MAISLTGRLDSWLPVALGLKKALLKSYVSILIMRIDTHIMYLISHIKKGAVLCLKVPELINILKEKRDITGMAE